MNVLLASTLFVHLLSDTDLEPKNCELHMASAEADCGFYRAAYPRAVSFNCRQFYSRKKSTLNTGQTSPRKSI